MLYSTSFKFSSSELQQTTQVAMNRCVDFLLLNNSVLVVALQVKTLKARTSYNIYVDSCSKWLPYIIKCCCYYYLTVSPSVIIIVNLQCCKIHKVIIMNLYIHVRSE